MPSLEAMVQVAEAQGVPLLLVNPLLEDRPSSNNIMQVRGRAERRALSDSFTEIFCMRLLYPSTGGYMYPIRGMLYRSEHGGPYVAYAHTIRGEVEEYVPIGAFPSYLDRAPDATLVSQMFTRQ